MKNIVKLLFAIFILSALFIIRPSTSYAADVVNPKQTYTYEIMVRDIKELAKKYPELISYKIIGNSEYNRPIYAVSLGTGNAKTFINGSHHAREWITTNLNMYMMEQYAKMYKSNTTFGGYNVKKVLDETTIWFVPMLNPDGVTLQQFGPSKFPTNVRSSLIKMNDGNTNFKKWKANAKGVDLNRQYNAGWSTITNNFSSPRWSNHKGYAPEQAKETKAIVKFTKEINPEMAVSYHSSGEILYWNFKQPSNTYKRDQNYAKKIGQYTGYRLINPGPNPSGGGYTDWFISTFKRPAFTPELGRYAGETHVPLSEFDRIWSQNKYIGLYTASEGYKLYLAKGGKPKYQEVSVKIDNNLMKFEQPALLVNGNTLVPIRGVFEQLGAVVEWNQKTYEIIARKGTTLVELKVGSKSIKVNGKSKTLDIAPQIINNHTLIPLRAVSEALGAEVGWDAKTTTALITSAASEVDTTAPATPSVSSVKDTSLSISGKSEVNSTVIVKIAGKKVGETIVNADGKFKISFKSTQPADTVISVIATDLAGNTSKTRQVTVQFTKDFTDTVGHWAQESIGYLKEKRITNGYPNGSFGVSMNISRAEAATFLVRALELSTENITNPKFPDVPTKHNFYKEIAVISQSKIMQGFPTGKFQPDHILTRAEMATILVNAFGFESKNKTTFKDVKRHWANEAINILASNGLSNGYPDGTFKPDSPIQRAEFGALIARVLQLKEAEAEKVESSTKAQETTEQEEAQKPDKQTQESIGNGQEVISEEETDSNEEPSEKQELNVDADTDSLESKTVQDENTVSDIPETETMTSSEEESLVDSKE